MAGYVPATLSIKERTFAMKEIWKDVVGYEGLYQVSNMGNVRSLNWKNCGYTRNLWLKPHNKGYFQVELVKNKKKKTFVVHRLVSVAFIPNPDNLPCVNHKDENKQNNCVDNLEWCDYGYNNRYSMNLHPERYVGIHRKPTPKYGKRKCYPIIQISLNGEIVREWENSRAIFLETGMSDWSISECCRGNRKTAYGYKWQYAS